MFSARATRLGIGAAPTSKLRVPLLSISLFSVMKLPGSATTRTLYVPAASGGLYFTVTTPLPPTGIRSSFCVSPIGTGRPALISSNCTATSLATTSPSLRTTA